jgi:hypothetical protein
MMTFDELGLTEREHASMLQVRNLFACGAIEHSPSNVELPAGSVFYMGHACFRLDLEEASSGALMCIGGWIKAFDLGLVDAEQPYATRVDQTDERAIADFVSEAEGGLRTLLHPDVPWAAITPPVVFRAIDTFLKNGVVDWKALTGAAGTPAAGTVH